jgi:hypothetical protein
MSAELGLWGGTHAEFLSEIHAKNATLRALRQAGLANTRSYYVISRAS